MTDHELACALAKAEDAIEICLHELSAKVPKELPMSIRQDVSKARMWLGNALEEVSRTRKEIQEEGAELPFGGLG